jgi:hypothetical protein
VACSQLLWLAGRPTSEALAAFRMLSPSCALASLLATWEASIPSHTLHPCCHVCSVMHVVLACSLVCGVGARQASVAKRQTHGHKAHILAKCACYKRLHSTGIHITVQLGLVWSVEKAEATDVGCPRRLMTVFLISCLVHVQPLGSGCWPVGVSHHGSSDLWLVWHCLSQCDISTTRVSCVPFNGTYP